MDGDIVCIYVNICYVYQFFVDLGLWDVAILAHGVAYHGEVGES